MNGRIIVVMPDGTEIDAPAGTTKAQIQAKWEKMRGGASVAAPAPTEAPAAPKSPWESTKEFAGDIVDAGARMGKSVLRGAVETAGQLGTVGKYAYNPSAMLLPDPRNHGMPKLLGELGATSEGVEELLPREKDRSLGGKVLDTGLESVGGGALLSRGVKALPAAADFVSGATSELAAGTLGDNLLTRLLGGIVGGGVTTAAGAKLSKKIGANEVALAQEALEGLPPDVLRQAQTLMQQAKAEGVSMDLAQAVSAIHGQSNLDVIRNRVAGSRWGDKVQQMSRAQPEEIEQFARMQAEALPGSNYGMEQSARNVTEAAGKRIKDEWKGVKAAAQTEYAKGRALTPDERGELQALIRQWEQEAGRGPQAAAIGKTLSKRLGGVVEGEEESLDTLYKALLTEPDAQAAKVLQQRIEEIEGAAVARPLQSQTASRAIKSVAKSKFGSTAIKPTLDDQTAAEVGNLQGRVASRLREMDPAIARGDELYARGMAERVDPLRQSVVGDFAPRKTDIDRSAKVNQLRQLFNEGTDPFAKQSRIRTLGAELNKTDPEVFRDAFKSYISDQLEAARQASAEGRRSGDTLAAASIRQALFKNAKQAQGVKDAIAEIAGEKAPLVIRGMENLDTYTRALQNRPEKLGGMTYKEFAEIGGNSKLANALRLYGFLPFERVARKVEDRVLGAVIRNFDTYLTTPEGVDMLAKLGQMDPNGKAAQRAFMSAMLPLVVADLDYSEE